VYGFCKVSSDGQGGWNNLIYANNGYVISEDKKKSGLDDPRSIQAMQFMEKMINENLMPPQAVMSETGEDVLFESGKVAMVPTGSWMVPAFRDNDYTKQNCDVVRLPMNAGTGRRCSIFNGLGWTIGSNTAQPDNAWKLVEYLCSKEGQLQQAELGITMSAYKGTSDKWKNSVPEFNLQAYLDMQQDMVIYPHSRNTIKWETAVNKEMLKAWTKQESMEDACRNAARKMNAILAEE
jgi:multiple sugar transport system substrate-binding protein